MGRIMLRRILVLIAVLAVPLSLVTVSALSARADESPTALAPAHKVRRAPW